MKKDLDFFIKKYLGNRPLLFSLIRSVEAVLFLKYKKYIKGKTLDFGCGDGFFAETVFGKRKIYIGLDLNDSQAIEAEKNQVYKKTVFYDGKKIPFSNNYFDSIISNCVLEHIPNLKNSLKEINRVLKPNGYFLTTVMTDNWEKNLFVRKIFGQFYVDFMRKKQDHYHLLSKNQWIKTFQSIGFKVIKIYPYLNQYQSQLLDIFHYFSLPSLFSYHFFRKWVMFKNWYKIIKVDKIIKKIISKKSIKQSSALFFCLKNKSISK